MLGSGAAWQCLGEIQTILAQEPRLARAIERLSLHDQLALTLELLSEWEVSEEPADERLPANVVMFRPRRG
jgi:hypothetical protein